ncbi:MAG: hypothetical protein HS126_37270 [Anaerolineales bacterium]|nr:hypothetical protein [Anaerolineales bacterium]
MLIENIAQSVEFSSDGRFVALVGCGQQKDVIFSETCSSGIVRVWDALSGQEVIRIDQGIDSVECCFSPDGHYIVTGDYDGLIQVRLYRPQDLIDHTCTRVTRNLTSRRVESIYQECLAISGGVSQLAH